MSTIVTKNRTRLDIVTARTNYDAVTVQYICSGLDQMFTENGEPTSISCHEELPEPLQGYSLRTIMYVDRSIACFLVDTRRYERPILQMELLKNGSAILLEHQSDPNNSMADLRVRLTDELTRNWLQDDGSLLFQVKIQLRERDSSVLYNKYIEQMDAFNQQIGSDLTIRCLDVSGPLPVGTGEIRGVKALLAQQSKIFELLIWSDQDREPLVELKEDFKTMSALIWAAHTGLALLSDVHHSIQLLDLADRYEFGAIRNQCLVFLCRHMPRYVIEVHLEELRLSTGRDRRPFEHLSTRREAQNRAQAEHRAALDGAAQAREREDRNPLRYLTDRFNSAMTDSWTSWIRPQNGPSAPQARQVRFVLSDANADEMEQQLQPNLLEPIQRPSRDTPRVDDITPSDSVTEPVQTNPKQVRSPSIVSTSESASSSNLNMDLRSPQLSSNSSNYELDPNILADNISVSEIARELDRKLSIQPPKPAPRKIEPQPEQQASEPDSVSLGPAQISTDKVEKLLDKSAEKLASVNWELEREKRASNACDTALSRDHSYPSVPQSEASTATSSSIGHMVSPPPPNDGNSSIEQTGQYRALPQDLNDDLSESIVSEDGFIAVRLPQKQNQLSDQQSSVHSEPPIPDSSDQEEQDHDQDDRTTCASIEVLDSDAEDELDLGLSREHLELINKQLHESGINFDDILIVDKDSEPSTPVASVTNESPLRSAQTSPPSADQAREELHHRQHIAHLGRCFDDRVGADIRLVLENGAELWAARFFLVSESAHFAEKLSDPATIELHIDDWPQQVITALVRSMYTGHVEIPRSSENAPDLVIVIKLMKAAKHFRCQRILRQLEQFVMENSHMTVRGSLGDFI